MMRGIFTSLTISSLMMLGLLQHTSEAASQRVKDLVKGMDLRDKAGQMTQLDIGIVTDWSTITVNADKVRALLRDHRLGSFLNAPLAGDNNGIWSTAEWRKAMRTIQQIAKEEGVLPLIHGLDSVHGANYVKKATMFPQQVGVAATFNPYFATEMGRITAQDTMAAGVQHVFGPILDLSSNARWPRMYETFSEDPYLTATMGAAVITGMQNFTYQGLKTAACMKHFIAYAHTTTGQDQSPVLLDKRDVQNYYLPPYRAAMKAGILSAMNSYNEISGVPIVSSREYLKDVLRYELGFEGMLVTDYSEINSLHGEHAVAPNNREAVRVSMQDTSVDMSMTAWDTEFATDLIKLVEDGVISMERLDESVTRIVQLKEDLGLLDQPFTLLGEQSELDQYVGSESDRAVALEAIRESVTLLKNDGDVLPLDPSKPINILVAGPTGHTLSYQSGGWTIHWHGPLSDSEFAYGNTLFDGISKTAAAGSQVDYLQGTDTDGKWVTDKNQLADRAGQADLIIVGIGEKAYAEAAGNIPDLTLATGQEDLVTHLAASSTAPIIVVLFEGRPRLLGTIPDTANAVVHGYLAGPDAGVGVSEILFGKVNPSGALPFTYPKFQNTPLVYYRKIRQRDYAVQWPFGYGLSYTSFAYEDLRISSPVTDENNPVTVSVTVRNTGSRGGRNTIMIFGVDVVRRITPEYKLLKAYRKSDYLEPGATQTLAFTLYPREDLAYYGVDRERVVESGDFLFGVGHEVDCRQNPSQCVKLSLQVSGDYAPICEAACNAWTRIDGLCHDALPAAAQKLSRHQDACMQKCKEDGDWSWNYFECLRNVVIDADTCPKVNHLCRSVIA